MNPERTCDAAHEVLSLADVKSQLRITSTSDDDSLREFIVSVRHSVEQFIQKTLITSVWEYKLDSFPAEICLPMGPIQSVTTVAYVDTNGDAQTFTDFQNDSKGRLRPAYGFNWPATRNQYDAVTITYVAGQTHAGNVAPDIKHAMLLLVGAADVGREDIVIGAGVVVSVLKDHTAKDLLAPYCHVAV